MVKKILCVLFVIVIFISATSCSNNKILVKNIEIEELLSSVELTYEYNVEDCCYTYKVYEDGIINGIELNTEEKIIDYI